MVLFIILHSEKKEAHGVNDLQMGYMNKGGGLTVSKNMQLKNIVF